MAKANKNYMTNIPEEAQELVPREETRITHIIYNNPVNGKVTAARIREWMETIDGYRSIHPVCLFDDGTFDDEDWFYRVLDKYDGPMIARYDRGSLTTAGGTDILWKNFQRRIARVVLLSFNEWKRGTIRREYAEDTFSTFIAKISQMRDRIYGPDPPPFLSAETMKVCDNDYEPSHTTAPK
jgi:hypothetical protein